MSTAFVVGNGSSLRKTPLHLLNGKWSWGVNRINLIYNDTSWRPSHYMRIETPNDDNAEDFWHDCLEHLHMGVQCYFPGVFRYVLGHDWGNWHSFPCDQHYTLAYTNSVRPWPTPWHGKDGPVCSFGSVVTGVIQLLNRSFSDQCDQIVLVGCDMDYNGKNDHFYDSSSEQRQPAAHALAVMRHAHAAAAANSEIPIYNATIGGNLDAYERIGFEDAIKRENLATW